MVTPMPEIQWGEEAEGLHVGIGEPEVKDGSVKVPVFLRNRRSDDKKYFDGTDYQIILNNKLYLSYQWPALNARQVAVYREQVRGPFWIDLSDYVNESDRAQSYQADRPLKQLPKGKYNLRVIYVGRNGKPRISSPEIKVTIPDDLRGELKGSDINSRPEEEPAVQVEGEAKEFAKTLRWVDTISFGADKGHGGKGSAGWSWLDPTDNREVTWTAEQAFKEATEYVLGKKPRQAQALRLYQRVLDANPSRTLELHVRLTMGARMTVLYNPGLGEDSLFDEALRWYKQIVLDFNDWGNHHDLMVAKIHLGDLYCMGDYGMPEVQKATDLCWEIIEVPEQEIVFDEQRQSKFNLDRIAKAEAPIGRRLDSNGHLLTKPTEEMNEKFRQVLLKKRETEFQRIRRSAIRAMTRKQHIPGFPLEVKYKRLLVLKQKRPDDQLYQETLEAMIQKFVERHKDLKSDFNAVLEEGLDGGNIP